MPHRGCRAGPARARIAADSFPIWSCSVWGLPCLRRYRRSGALLPHLFTLTPIPFGNVPRGPLSETRAVSSLWHLPSLSLDAQVPDVIRHTALRSPDFPLPELPPAATVQSACSIDDTPNRAPPRRVSPARTVPITAPAPAPPGKALLSIRSAGTHARRTDASPDTHAPLHNPQCGTRHSAERCSAPQDSASPSLR
jgi:hypothetical protein